MSEDKKTLVLERVETKPNVTPCEVLEVKKQIKEDVKFEASLPKAKEEILPNKVMTAEELEYEAKKHKTVAELQAEMQKEEEPKKSETKSSLIIEKPNFELMEELPPKKRRILSLKKKKVTTAKPKSKLKFVFLSLAMALLTGVCIKNAVDISNLQQYYIEANEKYELDLIKLISNIEKLDISTEGVDFIETYPEETPKGKISEETNWFDKLCNFLSGLFGG